MSDQKNNDGICLELKADGAAARASDQALSRLGQAATWLMPRRAAKVRITTALAERTAEKIRTGMPLDDAELFFVGQFFEKEARLLGNREAAAEEIHRVLPEVNDRLKELPLVAQATPSETFFNRAEGVASEISEVEIRQLFARLVAGEISRPGSFSLRTIEAVRLLDTHTARIFDLLCRFVVDGNVVICQGDVIKILASRGLNVDEIFELRDAGFIHASTQFRPARGKPHIFQYGQRRLRVTIEREKPFSEREKPFSDGTWISVFRLTRIGKELATVLPFNPDDDYFDMVTAVIAAMVGNCGIVEYAAVGSDEWTRVGTTKAS